MEPNFSSSSTSRVNVLFFFLFFFFFFTITTASAQWDHPTLPSNFHSLYTHHCNDVVPDPHAPNSKPLRANIATGYFTGGDTLVSQTHNATALNFHKGVTFTAQYDGPILRGYLALTDGDAKIIIDKLNGYHSDSGNKLCMTTLSVGIISLNVAGSYKSVDAVLKLNYHKNTSIFDILVTGTLESVSVEKDLSYFERVSILGLSKKSGYQPTFIGKGNGSLVGYDGEESLGKDSLALAKWGRSHRSVCEVVGSYRFEKYGLEYEGGYGNPVGGDVGYVPTFFVSRTTRCEDGKMQMLLGFPNLSVGGGYRFPFEPRTTLIAEGEWIEKENRILAVACRILNFTESLTSAVVGDCSTRLSFRLPALLSLRNRSRFVGQIWSNRTVNDSGYFGKIGFRSVSDRLTEVSYYKYEFTEYDTMRNMCGVKKTRGGKGDKYPDEHSAEMKLDLAVRNGTGETGWVHVIPLFVDGDQSHAGFWDKLLMKSNSSVVNMSYELLFRFSGFNFFDKDSSDFKKVFAEGIYDKDNGFLCMKACRYVLSKYQVMMGKDMLDCDIKINLQLSQLDAKKQRVVNGTIESTRTKSDPLYFEPMELYRASITEWQAAKTISRLDLENLMVLISNTLACVFVGWQLYYVKKNPVVLPFISIVMVVVLILGHIVPLLSSFQAVLVPNRRGWQDMFLVTGEWLKVSEVIVSGMKLVTFLLQLWLLQLIWSSRQGDRNQELLRDSERKVVYATLPLYIAGALISCFAPQWISTHHTSYRPLRRHFRFHPVRQRYTIWDNFKPYSGFVLDSFLLPQILFNLFFNSGEMALNCTFYFGSTIIRLLPHAYDLYRESTFPRVFGLYRYYANSMSDFYSTAWNIIIICGCLLFAAIVFLQQRLGGRCIIPKRFRQTSVAYEKVSVISSP